MATVGRMAIPTEIATLSQWFSPAFPVGAFAYSHGLEGAVETGEVHDADSAGDWLETVLRHGAGWNDAVLLAAAYRSEDKDALTAVDATCRALASSRERLMETDLQGAAFCGAVTEIWAVDLSGLSYPVAVGHAARLQGFSLELTTRMYLQAFVSNLASAAMRLAPLGQTQGQRLIRDLTPLCNVVADQAGRAQLKDVSSSAFLADIAAMKHETQYSRIFRT